MFNSEWFGIVANILFLWFLMALVVSFVSRRLARLLALESKQLWRTLSQLLDGVEESGGFPRTLVKLIRWRGRPYDPKPKPSDSLTAKLYATQAIQGLETRNGRTQKTRISFVPATVFSQAVIELAMSADAASPEEKVAAYIADLGNAPFRTHLISVEAAAHNDVDGFRVGLERWYDGQMSRASAIYRARFRGVAFLIGVILAVVGFGFGLNSNAFSLFGDLQKDSNLRTIVLPANDQARRDLAQAGGCSLDPAFGSPLLCELKGTTRVKNTNIFVHEEQPSSRASVGDRLRFLLPWRSRRAWIGILITAIATSFGPAFWYGALRGTPSSTV